MSALVGGIIAFVWSFVSWGLLPWYKNAFRQFDDVEEVACCIRSNAPCDGLYTVPDCWQNKDDVAAEKCKSDYRCGPVMVAAVKPGGANPSMVANLIRCFVILFIVSGLIGYIVAHIPAKVKYGERVFLIGLFGLIFGLVGPVMNWNWMSYPVNFTLISLMDSVITWFLAGLGIAKFAFVKGRR